MRLLLALGVIVAAAAADTRSASAQPWCAYYDPYTYNCGFYTFEQCLATISGVGGVCRRNPRDNSGYEERQDSRRPGAAGVRGRTPPRGGQY